MASNTEYLGLLKKDPVADAADTFNIQTMLNDNWNKIDAFAGVTPCMKIGSYVGSGGHGQATPNEIDQIGFVPDAVFIVRLPLFDSGYGHLQLIRPYSQPPSGPGSVGIYVSWGSDDVSWYYRRESGSTYDDAQCNAADVTYYYVILGHREVSE